MEARTHVGQSIKIVNDFVDVKPLEGLFNFRGGWSYGQYEGLQGSDHPSWFIHFCGSKKAKERALHDDVLRVAPGLEPLHQLWSLVKGDLAPDYGLIRAYASGHTFGVEGGMHHFSKPSDDELVALLYVNQEWRDAWAGETVFYDPSRECISIRPRPGRLILFDASIAHASRAPSRDCPTLCTTISFHMRRLSPRRG